MKLEMLYSFFVKNGYQLLNSNIPIVKFFINENIDENKINVVVAINNYSEYVINSEELKNIIFQIERKYLLSGIAEIKLLTIILSNNIERDKVLNEVDSNIWFLDTLEDRIIIFENQSKDFEELKEPLDFWCNTVHGICKDYKENSLKRMKYRLKNLPLITILLVLINIFVFVRLSKYGDLTNPKYMLEHGAIFYKKIFEDKEYYRFITCMFMHFSFEHLFNNMISLILIGNEVEHIYGRLKFLCIYFFSGILGSFLSVLYYSHISENVVLAGASGAIYGLIGALIVQIIQNKKKHSGNSSKVLIIFFVLVMAGNVSKNVDNFAHLGGLIGGMIISLIFYFFKTLKSKKMED